MLCYRPIDCQEDGLLLLVSVLSQAFFALVRRHLVSLVLLTVWHNIQY